MSAIPNPLPSPELLEQDDMDSKAGLGPFLLTCQSD